MNISNDNLYSMITEQEKSVLYRIVKTIDLSQNQAVIEFGVFFGGSLEVIAKGVRDNASHSNNPVVGVDAFRVLKNGDFSKLVLEYAQKNNLQNLLIFDNNCIDWKNIPQKQLSDFNNVTILQTNMRIFLNLFKQLTDLKCLKNFNDTTLMVKKAFNRRFAN